MLLLEYMKVTKKIAPFHIEYSKFGLEQTKKNILNMSHSFSIQSIAYICLEKLTFWVSFSSQPELDCFISSFVIFFIFLLFFLFNIVIINQNEGNRNTLY